MPSFAKSPPDLVAHFETVLAQKPTGVRRQMFGYPAFFIGGHLVTSLFKDAWVVRLPDAERAELLALPGARPFEPMAGRPMRGYALLPPDVVADGAALDRWVGRAIAFGRTLPPK